MDNISPDEEVMLRKLAHLYLQNRMVLTRQEFMSELGISPDAFETTLFALHSYNAVNWFEDRGEGPYARIQITHWAVRTVRELDDELRQASQPGDLVAEIKDRVRRHPVLSWVIVAVGSLTVLVTLATQTITLLEKLRILDR